MFIRQEWDRVVRPVINVDVDGIICDFTKEVCRIYNLWTGENKVEADITNWNMFRAFEPDATDERINILDRALHDHFSDSFACRYLELLPGAKELVAELRKRGEVIFVTSPFSSNGWCSERWNWIQEHFGKSNVTFSKDKSAVPGDVLIDDGMHNCEAWSRNQQRVSIMPDRPWNRDLEVRDALVIRTPDQHILSLVDGALLHAGFTKVDTVVSDIRGRSAREEAVAE
jgi:5'(3')-deoxyribonucleotidase